MLEWLETRRKGAPWSFPSQRHGQRTPAGL